MRYNALALLLALQSTFTLLLFAGVHPGSSVLGIIGAAIMIVVALCAMLGVGR